MTTPIGPEAQRPNPALEPLAPLLGDWRTTGGDKPGTATVLAVYRVADGLLQEGWALFADPRYPA